MRGGDDVVELEQGAVGARLLGEHVESGGGDPALLEGRVERGLVDDAASGGVDQHQLWFHLRQLLGADQAGGLRGLRQVHAHEVGLLEEHVEVDQADPHLGGATGLHVGVVGNDLHAEGAQPLRDEDADPTQSDDADGLLVELDPGVLRPLPLPLAQGRMCRADVPGGGEHEGDGELRGTDDVGGRRVDDHDPVHGGRADVDVVEPDSRAGDHLEPAGSRQGFGIDLGGGADQERVGVGDRSQEVAAVGAVAVPDLEVRAERLHGCRAELFGDEYDGLAHSDFLNAVTVTCARRCAVTQYPQADPVRPSPSAERDRPRGRP